MPVPEPQFIPKPGQTDYTNIRRAPVVNCLVRYNGKFLLVLRNRNMHLYPSTWNGISGFLDEEGKTVVDKIKEEIFEELGIEEKNILKIQEGKVFEAEAPKYNKTWIVHPVLVDIATDEIKLDWEAEEYKWVTKDEAFKLPNLMPGFVNVINALLLNEHAV